MAKSANFTGIVLKRMSLAEADRVVTFYTLEVGKVVALAKGVRKTTSTKKGALEPGTQSRFQVVYTRSWPLITQANLIRSLSSSPHLSSLTKSFQILEIVDGLTVENEPNEEVYHLLEHCLHHIDSLAKKDLLENIRLIIKHLGFTYDKPFTESKLKEYLEELINRPLKSKAYLSTNSSPSKS